MVEEHAWAEAGPSPEQPPGPQTQPAANEERERRVRVLRSQVGDRASANAISVLTELQADCYAGVWAHHANAYYQSTNRGQLIHPEDIDSGLAAAASVGDDRLQRQATGRVVPESFTHGSSAQRVSWFKTGLQTGDLRSCDTFGKAGVRL